MGDPIRARLDLIEREGFRFDDMHWMCDALRAVLDLCDRANGVSYPGALREVRTAVAATLGVAAQPAEQPPQPAECICTCHAPAGPDE